VRDVSRDRGRTSRGACGCSSRRRR
jgi:hypothetical protein